MESKLVVAIRNLKVIASLNVQMATASYVFNRISKEGGYYTVRLYISIYFF